MQQCFGISTLSTTCCCSPPPPSDATLTDLTLSTATDRQTDSTLSAKYILTPSSVKLVAFFTFQSIFLTSSPTTLYTYVLLYNFNSFGFLYHSTSLQNVIIFLIRVIFTHTNVLFYFLNENYTRFFPNYYYLNIITY